MPIKVQGQLFEIGHVAMTEGARARAVFLQRRRGAATVAHSDDMLASVHSSILIKFHSIGEYGDIHKSDKILNRNNIEQNKGRVLSVIGDKYPFVIITELPSGDTLISTPEEV